MTMISASAPALEALEQLALGDRRQMIEHSLAAARDPAPRELTSPPSDAAGAARAAAEEVPDAVLKLDLWFMAAPRAAPAARSALEVLADHVDSACLHAARLLVTELVTNSVRHAGVGSDCAVGLSLRLTSARLTVAISDPGSGFTPEIVQPDLEQEGGRGLFIVEQLAERWGVGGSPLTPPRDNGATGAGTVVWFELAREQAAAAR